jgi:hypothetical protein
MWQGRFFCSVKRNLYKITPTVICTVLTGNAKREADCGTTPSAELMSVCRFICPSPGMLTLPETPLEVITGLMSVENSGAAAVYRAPIFTRSAMTRPAPKPYPKAATCAAACVTTASARIFTRGTLMPNFASVVGRMP